MAPCTPTHSYVLPRLVDHGCWTPAGHMPLFSTRPMGPSLATHPLRPLRGGGRMNGARLRSGSEHTHLIRCALCLVSHGVACRLAPLTPREQPPLCFGSCLGARQPPRRASGSALPPISHLAWPRTVGHSATPAFGIPQTALCFALACPPAATPFPASKASPPHEPPGPDGTHPLEAARRTRLLAYTQLLLTSRLGARRSGAPALPRAFFPNLCRVSLGPSERGPFTCHPLPTVFLHSNQQARAHHA